MLKNYLYIISKNLYFMLLFFNILIILYNWNIELILCQDDPYSNCTVLDDPFIDYSDIYGSSPCYTNGVPCNMKHEVCNSLFFKVDDLKYMYYRLIGPNARKSMTFDKFLSNYNNSSTYRFKIHAAFDHYKK